MLTTEQRERLVALRDDCWPNEWEAIDAALADHDRMVASIREFCRRSDWAVDEWKRQAHVAPLFAIAKEAAEC